MIISFVIFNAESLSAAILDLQNMFGMGELPFYSKETGYQLRNYGFTIVIAMIGSTPLAAVMGKKLQNAAPKASAVIKILLLFLLMLLSTAYLVSGSFNPFLYFRF